MVEHSRHLDAVFHALSDPTRRAMLACLAEGERTIGELAMPFSMTLAGASKHVKVLEHAGLLRRAVQGRSHVCRLEPGPLAGAHEWLAFYESFWTSRLDALDHLLREEDARRQALPAPSSRPSPAQASPRSSPSTAKAPSSRVSASKAVKTGKARKASKPAKPSISSTSSTSKRSKGSKP